MRPRRRGGRSRGSSGVPPSTVAVGATVSGLVGLVASSLPDGSRVLAPDVEFTSTLFPFLVQAHRGVTVRTVPAAELAGAIDDSTDVVAFSAVQMATGEVADLAAIVAAAKAHGRADARRRDPGLRVAPARRVRLRRRRRGGLQVAALAARHRVHGGRAERLAEIVPTAAGWFAGEDVHASYFGGPLRLAADARRLDTSPAWHSWVGAAPALALLEEIGVSAIHAHDLGLANRFRAGLGLEPSDSAIVFVDVPDAASSPRAGGDQGGRARRPRAHVVAPLQHRRGRRPGASEALT